MTKHSVQTRLLAVFVVAFVCLNAGAAAGVAYCQAMAAAATDYCPLKKKSKHCDKTTDADVGSQATSFASYEPDYCPMTVSLLAGVVEKKPVTVTDVSRTLVVTAKPPPLFTSFAEIFTATFDYRGPPLLDRRIERIKHQLLLI